MVAADVAAVLAALAVLVAGPFLAWRWMLYAIKRGWIDWPQDLDDLDEQDHDR